MIGKMILFLAVMLLLWNLAEKLAPITQDFFAGQEWLTGIVSAYPLIVIIIFAAILSFYTNLFYKIGIDPEILEKMKASKKDNKEMQKKIKENKDNPQKMMELQKEMMAKSWQNASVPLKAMFSAKFVFLVTVPSLIFLFLITGPLYRASDVGYIINWGFSILGRTGAGWLLTLILLSFILTPITKKLLKVDI